MAVFLPTYVFFVCYDMPITTSSQITRHLRQDPFSPNRVYAASAEGGLWKTDNFFVDSPVWQPLTDNLGSLSASGIALSGNNPGTIYYATGDPYNNRGLLSYLFVSHDFGQVRR